jgi:hypothetical protein
VTRLFLRYGLQTLVILAPFFAPASWAAWAAKPLRLSGDPKAAADIVKGVASLLALVGVFTIDAVDLYIPRQQAREFGKEYAKRVADQLKASGAPAMGEHIRLNVMVVRFLWFEWRSKFGFKGNHRDTHMLLLRWQGLCGQSLRNRDHRFIDFRTSPLPPPTLWCFAHPFFLTPGQVRRTRHVMAILSVPMFRTLGPSDNPTFKAVGVLNLDAVSTEGADWLSAKKDEMAKFLSDHGTMLAYTG